MIVYIASEKTIHPKMSFITGPSLSIGWNLIILSRFKT